MVAFLQLRSCGKVEVAVLSLIVRTVSVDVKQALNWNSDTLSLGAVGMWRWPMDVKQH